MKLEDFDGNIETWFLARGSNHFPSDGNDYIAKYVEIKNALAKVHKEVTAGADFTDNTSLTWHDQSHIDKVIKQASKLLAYKDVKITAFETFVLLVAIQIHDVKNIEGREDHENRSIEIFSELNIKGLVDNILLKNIGFIASCHAGSILIGAKKEKDKISLLSPNLFRSEKIIHLRFIAALLRLADEYSDDSERSMNYLLKIGKIVRGSIIHQKHAESLNMVDIEPNSGKVYFDYHLTVEDALKQFPKYDKDQDKFIDVYLLDEIFSRTVKSHYETIYCMRYLRPYIAINKLHISIEIENLKLDKQLKINYELEEKGYPNDELTILDLVKDALKIDGNYWTGEVLKEYIITNNLNN